MSASIHDLNMKQRKAATALRAKRPMTVPGTNAIIVAAEARAWHDEVATEAVRLNLKPDQMTAFCDLAGVAD
jgi:hypothetical protein